MKFLWPLALVAVGLLSHAQAAVVRTFRVGNWSVGAYATDNGTFSHCAAGTKFNSNVTMLFSISKDYVWTVAFHNPEWVFQTGQRVTLTLAIDKMPAMKKSADAFNRSGVVITLEDDAELFRRFKSAKRVKISGIKESFEFEMSRMDEMLTKLLACAKQQDGSSNPQVAKNPFMTTKKGGDEMVAEATAFAANILADAKVSGYRFLGPQEHPLLQGDARWVLPGGGIGSIRVFPDIDLDVQKTLNGQLVAGEARACGGKFGSGVLPDDEKGSGGAFAFCDSGEMTFVLYYFTLPRVAGGAYAVTTGYYGAQAATSRAKEEHQKFREAVFAAR